MNTIRENSLVSSMKPMTLLPAPAKSSFANRFVRWHKEGGHQLLLICEKALLTLSLFGIPFAKKIGKAEKKFEAECFVTSHQKSPKPPLEPLLLKTKTATFNHTHDFAICEGVIWKRRRDAKGEGIGLWAPLYFPPGKNPTEIYADGANLIVVDQDRRVYYKKILQEFPGHDRYQAFDKSGHNNWKDRWFSLPIVNHIVNLFTGKLLQLPDHYRAIAIAHRGRYNDFVEDGFHEHEVAIGVTTLYVLNDEGNKIGKFDPWSPKNADMDIPIPEGSDWSYEALNMSVSASTILLVGYESRKGPEGGVVKTVAIKTKQADIDTEGWNPGLKYDYTSHHESEKRGQDLVRVIPVDPAITQPYNLDWKDHPLPLESQAKITSNLTILQTGEGNGARELRIEGLDQKGRPGYYHKNINDSSWTFRPCKISDAPQFLKTIVSSEKFATTVHDYNAPSATLKNFGLRSQNSELLLTVEDRTYRLFIHRKKSFRNFLGFKGDKYDLVIPDALQKDPFFKGQAYVPLTIRERRGRLTISAKALPIKLELNS